MDKEKNYREQFGPGGMGRDETIILFLRGLRIVLNNASAYPTDHPYFMKSVEDFQQKANLLLEILNPIKLHATPDSVFIDGRSWEKDALYVDLARVFHMRKIKTVEIRQGASAKELHKFLSTIGLPRRDFIRKGGCRRLMPPGETPHIWVEELDYSIFLAGGSQEVDVWVYLLREALEKEDRQKIIKLADSFGNVVGTFQVSDLVADVELRENIRKFIRYLREHYKEKLKECSQKLFSVVDHFKRVVKGDEVAQMKVFFKEVDEENLARVLWDELVTNEEFDAISLGLFVQLVDKERHGSISRILSERVADRDVISSSPPMARRMNELLSAHLDDSTSAVYQNIIAQLLAGIEYKEELSFDRAAALHNYRFILLSLMEFEDDPGRFQKISTRITRDWQTLTGSREYGYITELIRMVSEKKKKSPLLLGQLQQIEAKAAEFIESVIWEERIAPEVIDLLNSLEKTSRNASFYLEKIFREGHVNKYSLLLFLRFFPAEMSSFYREVSERCRQVDFMVRMVQSLSEINNPLAAEVLKYIYSCSNEFIKVEVLKGMKDLSMIDEPFLFSALKTGDAYLKRAAFGVLSRREDLLMKALAVLLERQTLWGSQVKLLLENMAVASEFKHQEVRQYMERLRRRRFFWNAPVRQLAQDIIRRVYGG